MRQKSGALKSDRNFLCVEYVAIHGQYQRA